MVRGLRQKCLVPNKVAIGVNQKVHPLDWAEPLWSLSREALEHIYTHAHE